MYVIISVMKYTTTDVKKLGTILGVYAHPDDECWTAGGLLAAACENGQRVVCVTATRGDAGQTADETRWPKARLADIREQELSASLAALGDIEHHWLEYADGTLETVENTRPVQQISELIAQINPDTILTFGPDGLTGHPDHSTVYEWAQAAKQHTGSKAQLLMVVEAAEKYATSGKVLDDFANVFWKTNQPRTATTDEADVCLMLPSDLLDKKMAALKAHTSQMQRLFAEPTVLAALRDHASYEYFMRAD